MSEAESKAAFDAAIPVPLSNERIDAIVRFATSGGAKLEGRLQMIGVEPGSYLGVTVIQAEGGQTGRYMVRPEDGIVTCDGERALHLGEFIDWIMNATGIVRVKLSIDQPNKNHAFDHAEFTCVQE